MGPAFGYRRCACRITDTHCLSSDRNAWRLIGHYWRNGWAYILVYPVPFVLRLADCVHFAGHQCGHFFRFLLAVLRTVSTHCNIKTSAISLGLSGVGALGVCCVLWWVTLTAFGEASKHPVEYPVSVGLGMLSFMVFVFLIGLYFIVRRKNWSIKGIVLDVLTSLLYLPSFFMIISLIHAAFNRIFGH